MMPLNMTIYAVKMSNFLKMNNSTKYESQF